MVVDFEPRFSRFGTAPESPPDDRDLPIRGFLSATSAGVSSRLPDEVGTVNADLHRHYVGITDQGLEGSCTGHAMRNTKGVNERRPRSASSRAQVPDFSARGIYHNAKQVGGYPEDEGAYLRDVTKASHQLGVPRGKDWPYIPRIDAAGAEQDIGTPSARWLQWSRPWAIGAYARVRTLDEMLSSLHEVGPLFVALGLTESFMEPDSLGYIPKTPFGTDLGGHAICILSAKQSERRFLIANSWGEEWGVDGYAWLDFDHFLTKAPSEAWAIPDLVR